MTIVARPTADQGIGGFVAALAARSPVPGGGSAAAVVAALGAAAGAMAGRYTTGKKWADRSDAVAALLAVLDRVQAAALAHADADAQAYAVLNAAAGRPCGATAEERAAAAAVPWDLLGDCVAGAEALAAFAAHANPFLVSDVRVGIHLLAGAGRAAHATWLANDPPAGQRIDAMRLLERLGSAERAVG